MVQEHSLNFVFTTGQYKEKSIREVALLDPSYLEWCISNMEDFALDYQAIIEIEEKFNIQFEFSDETINFMKNKIYNFIGEDECDRKLRRQCYERKEVENVEYYKAYYLNTTITFGKYKDKSIATIIQEDPFYLEWCILNLSYFCLDYTCFKQISLQNIKFKRSTRLISSERSNVIAYEEEKQERRYERMSEREDDYSSNSYYDDDLDMDQQSQEYWDNL